MRIFTAKLRSAFLSLGLPLIVVAISPIVAALVIDEPNSALPDLVYVIPGICGLLLSWAIVKAGRHRFIFVAAASGCGLAVTASLLMSPALMRSASQPSLIDAPKTPMSLSNNAENDIGPRVDFKISPSAAAAFTGSWTGKLICGISKATDIQWNVSYKSSQLSIHEIYQKHPFSDNVRHFMVTTKGSRNYIVSARNWDTKSLMLSLTGLGPAAYVTLSDDGAALDIMFVGSHCKPAKLTRTGSYSSKEH